MNNDLDAQFDKKIRELLKQVDDSQKKNIWKKTLRQSANVLKNDIKAEYRKQLHKGKYKTRYKTGRTVENVAVKDLSKKRYPLRKFELQFLVGVIDAGEDSTYQGFGRSYTSYWIENGTRDHYNYSGASSRRKLKSMYDAGHNMIRGIEETNLQSNALERRAESFLKEYQDKLLNNLWKAVKKSKKS